MRTGDLRACLEETERALAGPLPMGSVAMLQGVAAMTRLYLGQTDEGLDRLAGAVSIPLTRGFLQSYRCFANAIADRVDHARTMSLTLEPLLPVAGKRNALGTWLGLDGAVTGLALVGEVVRCAAV